MTSSKHLKSIECELLMNSVWLHEEESRKEEQIDIHIGYSCRSKPSSSVSLLIVQYRASIKWKRKPVCFCLELQLAK